MSKITLTDRISVSVRAKNDTQSSQQKVDTGKNIARSLGVDDYNDTDAATIGNTSKPTITDENGNEWVSMQDIIDAGKKMHQDGAFDKKTIYDGIGEYKLQPSFEGPLDIIIERDTNGVEYIPDGNYYRITLHIPAGTLCWVYYDPQNTYPDCVSLRIASKNSFVLIGEYQSYTSDGKPRSPSEQHWDSSSRSDTINNTKYSYFYNTVWSSVYGNNINGSSGERIASGVSNILTLDENDRTNIFKHISAVLFGLTHQIGGSLIDWTKPDDEIEEDIRQLHETWDVSEHEGAVTANGTYVLAGPIEYNDADSHSSGDF